LLCGMAAVGGRSAALSAAVFMLALAGSAAAAAPAEKEQRLAVVNVSYVFENYRKVPDVQRRIDDKFKPTRDELTQRSEALAKRNKDLKQFFAQANQSEATFDSVQKLRKDQYLFERDVARLNAEIQKNYTHDMREVLSDIRNAVRVVAEKGGFHLVLRSPDADDPEVAEGAAQNPAAGDDKTFLQLNAPKSVAEIVERFNRNPVLFGAKTVDITQDVLTKLNEEFAKRATGASK